MTKYTLIPTDKIIIKDGISENFDDNSFWSNYSNIHAIQIDTNDTSEKENLDGSISSVTQDEITTIENKYNSVKSTRETTEATNRNAFKNSWSRIRFERDQILRDTDKYLISDYPITSNNKTLIQNYRTALRNLPNTFSNEEPKNITIDNNGNVLINGTQVIPKPEVL